MSTGAREGTGPPGPHSPAIGAVAGLVVGLNASRQAGGGVIQEVAPWVIREPPLPPAEHRTWGLRDTDCFLCSFLTGLKLASIFVCVFFQATTSVW